MHLPANGAFANWETMMRRLSCSRLVLTSLIDFPALPDSE